MRGLREARHPATARTHQPHAARRRPACGSSFVDVDEVACFAGPAQDMTQASRTPSSGQIGAIFSAPADISTCGVRPKDRARGPLCDRRAPECVRACVYRETNTAITPSMMRKMTRRVSRIIMGCSRGRRGTEVFESPNRMPLCILGSGMTPLRARSAGVVRS